MCEYGAMTVAIEGTIDPRFMRVKEAFASSFATRDELGASVTITIDGNVVVDLWGGHVDKPRTRAWTADTLVNVFSTTKGVTALCALRLADEGLLDLDAPVARYWPEFAQADKGAIPVRALLNHQSGLAAITKPLPPEALFDWNAMTDALAAQSPWWPPGSGHGYHPVTFGWLVGEVVRRVSGKTIRAYFRDEIASKLGIDFHIGAPASEDARVSDVRGAPPAAPGERSLVGAIMGDPQSLVAKAFVNPMPLTPAVVNSRAFREAEIPAANGHATARGIARLYGALACGGSLDGVRLLSPEMIARARTEESNGYDLVLGETTRFGLGFMLSHPGASFGALGAFGHPGAGGSLGFADPEARIGFGYAMNKMGNRILLDPRATVLIDALYASL